MKFREKYRLAPPQLMMPWHPGRTVSTKRAAELLGCSEQTIIRMIQDGTLDAFKRRKTVRNNSPWNVIHESLLRVSDQWRREAAGVDPHESAPSAPAAPPTRGDGSLRS